MLQVTCNQLATQEYLGNAGGTAITILIQKLTHLVGGSHCLFDIYIANTLIIE